MLIYIAQEQHNSDQAFSGLICLICMRNVKYCFCRPEQCPLPTYAEVQMQLSQQMLYWLVAMLDDPVISIYLEALATSIALSVPRLINRVQ